jgi:hypothetical protein
MCVDLSCSGHEFLQAWKEGFGTTVNAEKDFLPGFEVFCTSKPLLWITKSAINQYESFDCLAPFFAAYDHVLDVMGSSEQTDFLRLRGPVTGDLPDQSAEVSAARAWNPQAFVQLKGRHGPLREIASIMRINAFETNGGRCIFAVACRISHSCMPNCVIELNNSRCICRCILPVTTGEKLTIEYNPQPRFITTCERRRIHAQTKDFFFRISLATVSAATPRATTPANFNVSTTDRWYSPTRVRRRGV